MQKGSHSTPTRMAKGKAFERTVRQAYENAGFVVLGKGLPDLLCVRGNQLVWIECKAGHHTYPRPHQKQVIKLMKQLGLTVIVQRDTRAIVVPAKPQLVPDTPDEIRAYLPLTGSSFRLSELHT